MSRINNNIQALQAQNRLARNNGDLAIRLQRLSTGLKINGGKDAPAGLIASETLRSEIAGINQAVSNSQRAINVVNTAEGALNEVSSLLLEIQSLTSEAANSGALSPDEIKANQLQVDAILTSVNRIANTTQFNGVRLLNGSLDYSVAGLASTAVDVARIFGAKLPDNGSINVTLEVIASAQLATVGYAPAGVGATPITIEIAGNEGNQQLTFAASAANSAIVAAVNQFRESTGVSAVLSGTALRFTSTQYGAKQFVSVRTISGTFVNSNDFGVNAQVNINGTRAEVEGLEASVRTADLDLSLTLDSAFATQTTTTSNFTISGGGAKFQLGSSVNRQAQVNIGIASVSTTELGSSIVGFLSTLGSGGENSLISGNTVAAQKIVSEAIRQVASLRARLGAFQKNILDTNINSLSVALENVTASESAIRDADFAAETSALTRAQVLVQANTSVLAQANSAPQNVLSLLQ